MLKPHGISSIAWFLFRIFQEEWARTGSCSLSREDLARRLGCKKVTITNSATQLVKAGLAERHPHWRTETTYTPPGGSDPRDSDSPGLRDVEAFLKKRLNRGPIAMTQEEIAKQTGLNVTTVHEHVQVLRKRWLEVTRFGAGGRRSLYAKKGAARNVEPPAISIQATALKYLKHRVEGSGTGSYSCQLKTIAKHIKRSVCSTGLYLKKLRADHLIDWINHGHYMTFTIVGLTAARNVEPPAISIQGDLLKFMRRNGERIRTHPIKLKAIAKATGWGVRPIALNLKDLRKKGLINTSFHGNLGHTFTVVAAPPRLPALVQQPIKRGRHIGSLKTINLQIIARWIEAGEQWPVTVQFIDETAAIVEPVKFKKAIPGTKPHKKIRDRVREAIRRYRASLGKKNRHFHSATKMISVAV